MNINSSESLAALENVIEKLTGPDGCPWDKAQTPLTLADYLIEESHELASAIKNSNAEDVCEEMGDVAFLLLFVASWYQKNKIFSFADSLSQSAAKMMRRHPHVFGSAHFENMSEQLKAWEKIKKVEKPENKGLFDSLPQSLPPLIKAYRIHSKAARAGFTWPEDEEVEKQVESEWLELLDALAEKNEYAFKHELGDMLFSLVELGRRKGVKATDALDAACKRFLSRYGKMEDMAKQQGKELSSLSLDEQDELWNKAKNNENIS